mmetsp:Transcript_54817/g.75979  ORF Transcript_54817/g.75979 Transcript_54817/m.75979 type:complete len:188 (+) Transcript_54817:84-647(+)
MNFRTLLLACALFLALAHVCLGAVAVDEGRAYDDSDSLLGDGPPEDEGKDGDDEDSVVLVTSDEAVCEPDDEDCPDGGPEPDDGEEECECDEDDPDCSCEESLNGWENFTSTYLSVMDMSIIIAVIVMAIALSISALKVFLIYRQGPTDHGLGLGDDDMEHSEIALDDVSANMFEIGEIDNEEDDVL